MASDLNVLIRLHKHQLDEKRIALGELYLALAQIKREQAKLEHDFALEKAEMDKAGDVHFTFARYAEQVRRHRLKLHAREQELEQRIDQAKDSMMETFSELKKYEMTQAERERLEKEEQRIREAKDMDDIGLEGFRRKGGES